MADKKGAGAPTSFAEGMQGVLAAITATMTAPDAQPHVPLLMDLQKAILGAVHSSGAKPGGPAGAPPGGAPPGGAPPGGAPAPPGGGGMNLGKLMGSGGGGPSAGPEGGPSSTGASADDIRRMVGAQAETAG